MREKNSYTYIQSLSYRNRWSVVRFRFCGKPYLTQYWVVQRTGGVPFFNMKFPYDPVCPLVGWLVNFLTGRDITLPNSYQSTCFLTFRRNDYDRQNVSQYVLLCSHSFSIQLMLKKKIREIDVNYEHMEP